MGDFVPNNVEMSYYNIAANRTYEYIKGLGESIKKDITVSIAAEELSYLQAQQEAKAKETIREEIEQGVGEKRAVKSISSRIAERMDDWNRDWGRIVETECQNVFSLGRAQYMMQNNPDPRVYFDVFPGACRHCIRLYLTRGVGSQPRVFRLGELMANGTNVGLKSKDWKPVVGTVHPFCRCQIRSLPEGYVWNEEKHRFEAPENYERKVERKGKVHITIGGRKYDV